MSNTGYKAYATLEQYYIDNGTATGVTKPNTIGDPDYAAPVLDLTYCPLPSASPSATPSISVTPTATPTPTPTPTNTPTQTPSISISPSIPGSPSYTPTATPTPTFTPTSTPTPTVTPSVTPSVSLDYTPTVTSVGGFTQPCIGGTCDDYLGWNIQLDQPVLVDTNYALNIELYQYGNPAYTFSAYGTILAGESSHNSDPCTGGGAYVGCNYYVNSTCITYIDPPVDPSTYVC